MLIDSKKQPLIMSPNPLSNNDFLNYGELSDVFSGKPQEFIKVLKMIHEDFLNNHILIMDAITEQNADQFKMIYHNLRGNINLFDMHRLRELMNKLEKCLEEGSLMDKNLVKEFHYHFNLISQSLENKIKGLS